MSITDDLLYDGIRGIMRALPLPSPYGSYRLHGARMPGIERQRSYCALKAGRPHALTRGCLEMGPRFRSTTCLMWRVVCVDAHYVSKESRASCFYRRMETDELHNRVAVGAWLRPSK